MICAVHPGFEHGVRKLVLLKHDFHVALVNRVQNKTPEIFKH